MSSSFHTSFRIFPTTTEYLHHLKRIHQLYDVYDLFEPKTPNIKNDSIARIERYLDELDVTFQSKHFPKHHFIPRFMLFGYRVAASSAMTFDMLHSALYYWLSQSRLYAPYYTLNPVQYLHAVDPLTHDRLVYVYVVNMNYLWHHTSYDSHNDFMKRTLFDARIVYESVQQKIRPSLV